MSGNILLRGLREEVISMINFKLRDEEIKELEKFDSGNGSYKYLTEDNICSIYDQRPDACDVKKMYESIYKKKMEVQYIAKQKYAVNMGKKIVYKVSCVTK